MLALFFAFFLVVLNGMFVAAEFGFVKARKTRLELLATEGNKNAKSALFGITHLDAYLSVCQLGITLASLGLGWIGEPAVAHLLEPVLRFFNVSNPAIISSFSIAIGFSFITLLHVVFGELAPKSISIQKAEKTVLLLAQPMRACYILCFPLVLIMNGISNAFLRLVKISPASEAEQSHSPEELRMLILDSSKGGTMDANEGRMLDNIFSFYQKTAKDIMVHRTDTISFQRNDPPAKAMAIAQKCGHSRFPIYDAESDAIVGFVHARDIARLGQQARLVDILRAPEYAPETMRLDRLLHTMQSKKQQFCIVVDEYGDWQGILTMEDLVEAIVGDIQDEFDNEDPDVLQQSDGSWSISADLSLDDLMERIPMDCIDSNIDLYMIIAGHLMERLGKIPQEGDAIILCDKRFTVIKMDRNRIRRVRVESIMPEEAKQKSVVDA